MSSEFQLAIAPAKGSFPLQLRIGTDSRHQGRVHSTTRERHKLVRKWGCNQLGKYVASAPGVFPFRNEEPLMKRLLRATTAWVTVATLLNPIGVGVAFADQDNQHQD